MLKLRVREYTPAGVRGRVLPATDITYTDPENASATLQFALSTKAAGRLDAPFVVGVEYAIGDAPFQAVPRNDLFLMDVDSGDDADQSKTVTFTGQNYLSWLLAHAYLWWTADTVEMERTWREAGGPASAGYFLHAMVTEAQSSGWAPWMTVGWTTTHDSAGQAWHADEKVNQSFRVLTLLSKVMDSVTEQGLADYSTQGMTLNLYRPGTGRDLSEAVSLGGPGFSRVPVKSDSSSIFNRLTIVPEKAGWTIREVPDGDFRFGKLEAVLTQSGVEDLDSAAKLAQPTLVSGAKARREESFEWSPQEGDVMPWRDFTVGDTVTARARGGKLPRRVIGLVVRDNGGTATVRAIVGEKITVPGAALKRRLGSVSVGGTIGGSGNAFPSTPGLPSAVPDKPDALHVTSNTGAWGPGGSARSTVLLAWGEVTAATDGTEVRIDEYEVWSRLPSGVLTRECAVAGTTAVVETWAPGVERFVAVRARSSRGVWSEFSLEIPVTPAMPSSVVPKAPAGLDEVSNTGAWTAAGPVASVTVSWDAVTESTDDSPVEIAEYEMWDGSAPVARFPSASALLTLPSGRAASYRVRARSVLDVWGDLSAPLSVTGALPGVAELVPTVPILTSGSGVVVARWDGEYTTAPTAAARTVQVEARIGAGSWIVQGAALTGPGSNLVRLGDVGDTVSVRLVAYDPAGRETGVSEVASIEISGIDGADIIAGTIEGNRIVAGTVSADELVPNIGQQLNLFANEAIVLMAGRQDSQDTQIAAVADAAATAGETAEDAVDAAANAAAAAAAADGKALVAQSQAQTVSDRLTAHQAVFRVTPTGAEVATADGSNVLSLLPSGVQIIQGGTPASTWDAGRLIVNETIVNRAQLANHVVEKSGTRSTWRPI